ncbi:MAG: lamin tail domain-containing protein [Bacteroidales bacterium]|nr:lamin tail domain-containing protein [Bacteroidales bacterium]
MKKTIVSLAALAALALVGCEPKVNPAVAGLVINEVAAHDDRGLDSWVELYNNTASEIPLAGITVTLNDAYFVDKVLYAFGANDKLAAGERCVLNTADNTLVTGFSSEEDFTITVKSGNAVVAKFSRDKDVEKPVKLSNNGSYQRLPDGTGAFIPTTSSTRGRENIVYTLENTKHNAIWVWSSRMEAWLEDDCAYMKDIKRRGYDHVLLNYSAFEHAKANTAKKFLAAASANGLMVHAWVQAFYSGGSWVNPIDPSTKKLRQDVFDKIIANVNTYLDEFGVDGIHLDYIRYPGTASKYSYIDENGVTCSGAKAVAEFCRQLRENLKKREVEGRPETHIVVSAALMAEGVATGIKSYGQDPYLMGKYIDVLMPMIYRYQSATLVYGEEWARKQANEFALGSDAQVWAGTTTYCYGEGNAVTKLGEEQLRKDCEVFLTSRAKGVVLFRDGLGQPFPDVNDLDWDNTIK